MHKDANLRKRNALVIPGGLLAFYGLAGLLYAKYLRSDAGTCGDASLMVFAGACRSALLVMAIPVVIGLALVGVGAFAFRGLATCRHGHGSWTHFTLALLVSLVLVPLLGIVLAPTLLGADPVFVHNSVNYPVTTIMAGLATLGVLMLVPFGFLYAGQTRANPCCTEKGCFTPCFCDEAMEAAPEAEMPAEAPPSESTGGEWKALDEPAAPTPPPMPLTPPPPEQPPATPPPMPAPEPKPEPEPAKEPAKASAKAPRLATRPTDPAAEPADEMAAAAQWAQEDGDDEEDAGDGKRKSPARRSRPAKSAARPRPKAKSAKASKKKT